MNNNRGSVLIEVVIHIILIALVLAGFLFAVSGRVNGRDLKQQILEKQMALLIDSSDAGMTFTINSLNINGLVDSVSVRDSRIFIGVDGFPSVRGYPYFSKHIVSVRKTKGEFIINVGK